MDWASSQWKQELPPSAIQKINVLEEKIERLQKERQQKQLQCECLELALEKEKRKVENEKQQTSASQRELQSLADICKDLENKHQRLQNEVQSRDNRIESLETLLSQSKKENCRLQQLENDLKELRCVRESTLLEKERKNESFNLGQNTVFPEEKVKDCLSENSETNVLAIKENNKENHLLSSLRKKIAEQEEIIQDLSLKLKEGSKEQLHTSSKTPGRPQIESVEASPALRNKSIWNSFTTTPAKENKEAILRHHHDSFSSGSSDEKVMALQTRLKQLAQELDCQRHNFEASKVSMEQKFKENENSLKAELKYQIQANTDLDKELKDIKNKYQQEINQSTKQLDIISTQLKKTQNIKEILEKEVKNMESKISGFTLNLKTKEEEVQDLQKLKNMAETTIQSLQAQVSDLERKCKSFQEQDSTLRESLKSIELQLDGSCNLVKDREANLAKVTKELENISFSHKNLLEKIHELDSKLNDAQKENTELIHQLEECSSRENLLKEKLEATEKEKTELLHKLGNETKKLQELEINVVEHKQVISHLKEELSKEYVKNNNLSIQLSASKEEYETKISTLESTLSTKEADYAVLESKHKELSANELSLKEKMKLLENEKEKATSLLETKTNQNQCLESTISELESQIKLQKEELARKSLEYNELKNSCKILEEDYENKIHTLEAALCTIQESHTALENKLKECSVNELSLKEKLDFTEKEKEEISSLLKTESNLRINLESSLSELNEHIKSFEVDIQCKSAQNNELKIKIDSIETEYQTKISTLESTLSTKEADYAVLESKHKELSANELSLKEKMNLLEKEKEEATSLLETKTNQIQCFESSISELESQMKLQKEELTRKLLECNELKNSCKILAEDYENRIHTLEDSLCTIQESHTALEIKLKECSVKELSLKEKLDVTEKEKREISSLLKTEKDLRINLESSLSELNERIKSFKAEIESKSVENNELKIKVDSLEIEYQAKIQQMERELNAAHSENIGLENKLKDISLSVSALNEKLKQLNTEKEEILSHLSIEKKLRLDLESSTVELNNNVKLLEEEVTCKYSESNELEKRIENARIEYEAKLQELEQKLLSEQKLSDSLQEQLNGMSKKELSLTENISLLKKEKDSLSEKVHSNEKEMQMLQINSAELEKTIQTLNNELNQKSLDLDKIQNQVLLSEKEYEAKFQDLNAKLSSINAEYTDSQNELRKQEDKLKFAVENNKKLNEDLNSEISKSENLQCLLGELKVSISHLEEELSKKSTELEEVNKKMAASKIEYEEKIQNLLVGLNSDQSKHSLLESQLEEYKLNETLLKDKIIILEKDVHVLSSRLDEATEETQKIRLDYENQSNIESTLRKDLIDKGVEVDRLYAEIEHLKKLYEVDVGNLETRLIEAETEASTTIIEIQKYKEMELTLMQKLDSLSIAKQKITSCLNEEICKRQKFESIVEQLKKFIISLEHDLSCMSEECGKIDKNFLASQCDYEFDIKKLESELSAVQEMNSDLKVQLASCFKQLIDTKEKLAFVEKEREQMSSGITAESNKVVSLKKSNAELHSENVMLREQLSCQSLKIDMNKAIESVNGHKKKIEELQSKLLESEAEQQNFQKYIDEMFKVELSSEMEFQKLETENKEITLRLENEIQKTMILEKEMKHIAKENRALKEELDCKCSLLNDMEVEKAQYRAKLEQIEKKLDIFPKDLLPEENMASAKDQPGLQLNVSLKMSEFDELKTPLTSWEENLSLSSFQFEELSVEYEIRKEEFERTVQKLQAEISGAKSENELLRVQMKDVLLNAEMSQNRLRLIEKEKQDLNRQLNFENKKIKMLELGIQELKKIILTLQVLLISYNGDIKGLNTDLAVRKDCSELKDEVIFTKIPTEKMFTSEAEIENSPTCYFPELKSFSSLPEKEFSAALEKFSLFSLSQICDLENNMITKLEKCKFLCSYQLIESEQLNEIWKKFSFFRKKLDQIQLLKKFLFCFCGLLKSSLVAHILRSVNKVALVKVFPKNFGFTLKDFLYLCNNAFNKILFSVSQMFEKESHLVNRHSVFFNNFSTIHDNTLHLPVVKKNSFILWQAKFRRFHRAFKPIHVSQKKPGFIFATRKQDVKKALNTLKAPEVPFFLNFTMSLMENIGKECCSPSNNPASVNYSMSVSQMQEYLSLLEPLSPLFHILSKYCLDVLNSENIALQEICYWKHHCSILGIDKSDVQKLITLLEHVNKHKKCEKDIAKICFGSMHGAAKLNENSLEQSLKIEKDRHKLLNDAIEEIEKDLGETFLQKEKFKKMALDVGKMLHYLEKYDTESFVFSDIQLDGTEIFSERCFCENCIMDEDMCDGSSHNVLKLQHCLKWIDRLISVGRQLEEKVHELKNNESEFKSLSKILRDQNSDLEMTINQCSRNLENANNQVHSLTYDLQKQMQRYKDLSQSVNEKDILNMRLEAENSSLLNTIDEYKTKLKEWEDKVSSLSTDQEKLEFSLLLKEEVESLKAISDKNACLLNETQLKCEEYRNEIHLLNSRISKYEEEKIINQHIVSINGSQVFDNSFEPDGLDKSSKTIINELQAKIDSLTKCNNSLNLTIENVEEELKNVYMEKQSVVEELGKLSEQINCFKQEISVSTQKYNDEKKSNENLLSKLKEYENIKAELKNVSMEKQKTVELSKLSEQIACLKQEISVSSQKYDSEKRSNEVLLSKLNEYKNIEEELKAMCMEKQKIDEELGKLSEQITSLKQENSESTQKYNDEKKSNEILLSKLQEYENIKAELKNACMEKQSAVEELDKLSEQIASLKQEISVSSQKYDNERKSNEILLSKLQEYEKIILDNEHVVNELKAKNVTLEKNACLIKTVAKEHEQIILKKSSDLIRCHDVIEKLQKRIAELDEENSNLKTKTKVVEKLETSKSRMNELMSQKSQTEGEIKKLKLVEIEKAQILEKFSELDLQRSNLTEKLHQLALELETEKKRNADLEIKCDELSKSLKEAMKSDTLLKEELNKNKNLISHLNEQLEEFSTELKSNKSFNYELNTEISRLKSIEKHLTQTVETLSKNLKSALDKVTAEHIRNKQLMSENDALKMKGNALVDSQKLRNALNEARNFIANVLNIILCAVKSYPESTDFEELKENLTAVMVHLKHNPENDFHIDVCDQLSSFFGTLINNHKDDLEICGIVSTIKDSIKKIANSGEPYRGVAASLATSPDTIANMSIFESTFAMQRKNHSSDILTDLQYIKAQTDEIIFNFKTIISKNTEEIEKLNKELKELHFTTARNGSKATESEKTSFKWKYELIKRQYRLLEEKYNKVLISSEQMEETIKILEEKNKSLEEEAEDLCRDLKNMEAYYSSSDELLNALTELNALRHKLKELERENNWLKKGSQGVQLPSVKADKQYPPCSQRQTQIPKYDRTCLKENNTNRSMT